MAARLYLAAVTGITLWLIGASAEDRELPRGQSGAEEARGPARHA